VALAATVTLRPTLAIVAVWWLLRGLWRPVLWTALAGAAIVLVTLPFVGIHGWTDYVAVVRNLSDITGVPKNVDLGSAVLSLGGPEWLASIALLAGYGTALAAILVSLRRDREVSYVVAAMSSLLLSPLMWDHYLTMLLLPGALLASRGRWWGLGIPLAAWIPLLAGTWLYPVVAIAGLLLPFAAPDRGERAGTFVARMQSHQADASDSSRA
jgi:hypothetical protein